MGYRKPLMFGLAVVVLFFGSFGTWAAFAPLESAAIARGEVVVEGNSRTIQHLEGGIVEEILVRDGDIVEEGQPLVVLQETQARSSLGVLYSRYRNAVAREARLLAMRDQRPVLEFPEWLEKDRQTLPEVNEILRTEMNKFESDREMLDSQVAILSKRKAQYREEITGLQGEIRAADDQIATIREELTDMEFLVQKGLGRKSRLLALERQEAQIAGRRSRNVAMIARARQSIGESDLRIADLETNRNNEVIKDLREVQAEVTDLEERIAAARDVLQRTVIRAPTSGEVVNLSIHTRGGVITPGQNLLEIVPAGDSRIISAHVDPNDIDVVHRGLKAQIRFVSLSARTAPTLKGEVTNVSADSISDERTGVPFYKASVRLNEGEAEKLGDVDLFPGMPVEVMIVTGSRTALDYLTQPITGTFRRGLRED